MSVVVAVERPRIPPKTGSFTINLNLNGLPTAYRNSEYAVWLNDMKTFYERIVTSRNHSSNPVLNIDATFTSLSGSTLAQCGPGDGSSNPLNFLSSLDTFTSGTSRPNYSTMKFNTNYYKEPPVTDTDRAWKRQFFSTAIHEGLHALGLGVLWNGSFKILISWPIGIGNTYLYEMWNYNRVGTGNTANPRYTAAQALGQYRNEMVGQSDADHIPIHPASGSSTALVNAGGTALCHWRGTDAPTGIRNARGQDFWDEIFTAWSSRDEGVRRWFGRFTLGALRDIGYLVNYAPLEIAINDWKTV